MSAFRIGQGIDVHAFSEDPQRRLVLAGITIPGAPGLEGHSDADVVLHALTDAVLGAAGLGDLGTRYGTDDPAFAGANSRRFLADAGVRAAGQGWTIGNADVTIIAARPRIAPYREDMCRVIADVLGTEAVSVKATTTDGLGLTGRGEGIAALAVVLLTTSNA